MVFTLKIGYVSRYPPVHCGVGEYTRLLVHGLKSVYPEAEIYILASTEAGEDSYIDREANVRIIPSFDRGEASYERLLQVLNDIGGVDVLHVQHEYGIFGLNSGIARQVFNAKEAGLTKAVVFTMHTVYHVAGGREEAVKLQSMLSLADAVIIHSVLQEFELQVQGVDPTRIRRIPHGTLINPYLGYSRGMLSKKLGLGDLGGSFILATPGFLRYDKGLDLLIEALNNVESDAKLIIAGEKQAGYGYIDVEDENIILIERYLSGDEILALAALADVIVLPYRDKPGKYSVSGILHLSMGSLKPIIGTRVPRLIELYEYAPRLTIPPRSVEDLSSMIRWVKDNYDLAVSYTSNVYSYAASTQWPRIAYSHLKLYRSLISKTREKPVRPFLFDSK